MVRRITTSSSSRRLKMAEKESGVDAATVASAPSLVKRPTTYDPRVREAVARSFKSEVDEWSRAGNVSGDVVEDIAAALAHASSWDGFDLARELQREVWECNFELCEILEG